MKSQELYIGLMSGTSMDAVDAVLVDFSHFPLKIIGAYSKPIPEKLKNLVTELGTVSTQHKDPIDQLATLDVLFGRLFAKTALQLLKETKTRPEKILAIGSHGQTVRHRPDSHVPYTLQIADPNVITAQTEITTVADFRRRDVALGGQGAPLVPAFHQYLFQNKQENRWIVNIGGIANVTFLGSEVFGFDTGPGNTLLDVWCFKCRKKAYDREGKWAASGKIIPQLLAALIKDPYFHRTIPKSTSREYFNLMWLQKKLNRFKLPFKPEDVQATLVELTARTIIDAITKFKKSGPLWLCGGGVRNHFLVKRIKNLYPDYSVSTTQVLGLDPQEVEAAAFAWLARETLNGRSGNIPTVTGANRSSPLGCIVRA